MAPFFLRSHFDREMNLSLMILASLTLICVCHGCCHRHIVANERRNMQRKFQFYTEKAA